MLVNSHPAGDTKLESVIIDSSQPSNKKKRKPKKPKVTETLNDISNPTTSEYKEKGEVGSNPPEKKKKKRNKKKKLVESNEENSENLISTTSQASKKQSTKDSKVSDLNGVIATQAKDKDILQTSKLNIGKGAPNTADAEKDKKEKRSHGNIKSDCKSPLRLQNKSANEEINLQDNQNQQKKKKPNKKKKKKSVAEEDKSDENNKSNVENKLVIPSSSGAVKDNESVSQISTVASDNSQQQKVENNKKSLKKKTKSVVTIKLPPELSDVVNKGGEQTEENKKKRKPNKNKKKKPEVQEIVSKEEDCFQESNRDNQTIVQVDISTSEELEKIPENKYKSESVSFDECDTNLSIGESDPNKKPSSSPASTPIEQKSIEANKFKNKKEDLGITPETSPFTENLSDSNSNNTPVSVSSMDAIQKEKSREEVLAAREAKRLAKLQAKKAKSEGKTIANKENTTVSNSSDRNANFVNDSAVVVSNHSSDKTNDKTEQIVENVKNEKTEVALSEGQQVDAYREAILAEREAKKLAKKAAKAKGKSVDGAGDKDTTEKTEPVVTAAQKYEKTVSPAQSVSVAAVSEGEKKKTTTKAERRGIQEAQRAAKAKLLAEKQQLTKAKVDTPARKDPLEVSKVEKSTIITSPSKPRIFKVKLFNHLQAKIDEQNSFANNQQIHPAMVKLGEQYAKRIVVGSNARCIAFLDALKTVIQDYETPPKKEFARGLEATIKNCVDHLQKCRPLAVSVHNAYRYIKMLLTKLPPNQQESDLKKELVELIENYIKDQIEKAAQGISYYVQGKITDGDVILTYGCSSLINYILEEAHRREVNFRVVVVDSRPYSEGQELLRRLVSKGISCTCVLINAVGFIMPEVTKVLLGAHALLANGYVMSRTGTAQVALVARSFNVPVLVCCETHKFSERVQTDAIVYNELGDPNDLISKTKDCRLTNWKSYPSLYPLNLNYDVTPPELVTAVVTEIRFLPCTSAPVILRIRPSEMVS